MRSTISLQGTERRSPTRTCVGCGQRGAASELVRVVASSTTTVRAGSDAPAERAPEVVFDLAGGAPGRGAHLHPRAGCLSRAPRRMPRALKCNVTVDAPELGRRLRAACDRRMAGLLLAARRLGSVAVGEAASIEAIRCGAPLVIVAADAGAAGTSADVACAVAAGRAIAWKRKFELGGLLGGDGVAICAVRHRAIAAELRKTRALANAGAAAIGEGVECSRCPEAR